MLHSFRVAFDAMGDRMFAEYEVINLQDNNRVQGSGVRRTRNATVGSYKYSKVQTDNPEMGTGGGDGGATPS